MDERILGFVKKHRISVLTTILPNGIPHSASMHYATKEGSLDFIFFTKEKSRKCSHFEEGRKYPASLVIGFSEEEWVELQTEGTIEKVNKSKSKPEQKIFASKFDGAELDNDHVVLKYTPTWWRYTEFKPKFLVLSSE